MNINKQDLINALRNENDGDTYSDFIYDKLMPIVIGDYRLAIVHTDESETVFSVNEDTYFKVNSAYDSWSGASGNIFDLHEVKIATKEVTYWKPID